MSESARSVLKHLYKEGRMTEAQYQKIDRNLKERPHGEWEACLDTEYCKCSYCGTVVMLEESVIFHFCPNCGADMRKKEVDIDG